MQMIEIMQTVQTMTYMYMYLPDLPTFITIGIGQFHNSCDFYEYLNMNIVDDDVACPKISAATPAVQRSFSLPCQLKWWSGSGDNDNN